MNYTPDQTIESLYSVQFQSDDPIGKMSINDIIRLQSYLEKIKTEKINYVRSIVQQLYPRSDRNVQPGQRGSIPTRTGKKIQQTFDHPSNFITQTDPYESQDFLTSRPDYYNPYEHGPKQNVLPAQYYSQDNKYYNDPDIMHKIGANDTLNDRVKNVNVESGLLHSENSRIHGKGKITTNEIDRFNYLPFDPQDTNHIVWNDDMPQGGYATRNQRM